MLRRKPVKKAAQLSPLPSAPQLRLYHSFPPPALLHLRLVLAQPHQNALHMASLPLLPDPALLLPKIGRTAEHPCEDFEANLMGDSHTRVVHPGGRLGGSVGAIPLKVHSLHARLRGAGGFRGNLGR